MLTAPWTNALATGGLINTEQSLLDNLITKSRCKDYNLAGGANLIITRTPQQKYCVPTAAILLQKEYEGSR